ncbi:MAG TPA: ArsR family transcriptional regulator [Nitrososphaerales archaeon]|nr:ArsR family transcriptional regulator [Nitrososphaerales archaeon]
MVTQTSLGETKHRILLQLLEGPSTAQNLASKLALNMSVIRRHLDDLASQDLVESTFKRAGRGRPSKHYSISVEGRGKISSRYDLVAEFLTMAIENDEGKPKSRELYESAGQILAGTVGQPKGPETLRVALDEFGFEPQMRKEGKIELVISRNCPILKLSKKYPELVCEAFHTAFLSEALKKPNVVLRQAIARGATECIHAY